MLITRSIGFLTLFFYSIFAFSAYGHGYLGASLAASFATLGYTPSQISYFSGDIITDAYPLNNTQASAPVLSVNSGYEFTGSNWKPSIALGLGIYGNLANYHYKGQVIETAAGDASSTLYHYKYHVNSTRLMAEIQLAWMTAKLSPFVSFGVGSSWSRMQDYNEMAVNSTGYPPLLPFQSHTQNNPAYQAGLGISKAFNYSGKQSDVLQERISLGYRYVNLGKTSFGTRGAVYPYKLNTHLLQTNDVYMSYTHLF